MALIKTSESAAPEAPPETIVQGFVLVGDEVSYIGWNRLSENRRPSGRRRTYRAKLRVERVNIDLGKLPEPVPHHQPIVWEAGAPPPMLPQIDPEKLDKALTEAETVGSAHTDKQPCLFSKAELQQVVGEIYDYWINPDGSRRDEFEALESVSLAPDAVFVTTTSEIASVTQELYSMRDYHTRSEKYGEAVSMVSMPAPDDALTTHDWALDKPEEGSAQCSRCGLTNDLSETSDKLMVLGTHDGEPLALDTSEIDFNSLLCGTTDEPAPETMPCTTTYTITNRVDNPDGTAHIQLERKPEE